MHPQRTTPACSSWEGVSQCWVLLYAAVKGACMARSARLAALPTPACLMTPAHQLLQLLCQAAGHGDCCLSGYSQRHRELCRGTAARSGTAGVVSMQASRRLVRTALQLRKYAVSRDWRNTTHSWFKMMLLDRPADHSPAKQFLLSSCRLFLDGGYCCCGCCWG